MTGIFKSTVATTFVIALSSVAVTGYAADKQKSSTSSSWPSFSKVDTDKSGSISMDEARSIQGLSDNFTQYDKNNDGQLSRSEYEAAKKSAKAGSSTKPSSVGGGSTPGGAGAADGAGAGGSSSSAGSAGSAGSSSR